ncbi:hypothetical protein FRC12_009145 [Ceratobasidium sp. 428]|nr:hypothetical protein FRC12_009145 [Ceratobasidium sp. 428]
MSENSKPRVNASAAPKGASQGDAKQATNAANDATTARLGTKRPRTDSMNAEVPDAGMNISKSYIEQEKTQLIVEDKKFLVHTYKIKEFAKLKTMLEEAAEETDLRVLKLNLELAASIERLLELLYAPIYTEETFAIDTLVTALVFATRYEHPRLRQYAIRIMESRQDEIPPMKRIQLSRVHNLPKWQPGAIDDLAKREQILTLKEANELGAELFADVCSRRELAKYNKGMAEAPTGRRR